MCIRDRLCTHQFCNAVYPCVCFFIGYGALSADNPDGNSLYDAVFTAGSIHAVSYTHLIQLDTLYESSLYKVVAVYAVTARTEDADFFAFNTYVDFDTDEEEQEYLDEIEQRAFYTTGDYVQADEKLLSLCTCTYQMEDARLVVMARPLRAGESLEAGTVTVSYTHLDVYKRQSLSRRCISMTN